MARTPADQLSWSTGRRMAFIEFRVFWHGRINRADLMRSFGIARQQASSDLSGYAARWPQNLVYDFRARAYLRGPAFDPQFITPSAEDYLTRLRALDQGLATEDQSWIATQPAHAETPAPVRGIAAETLRAVLAAIEARTALEVTYQSMSRPEPGVRRIEPHALAFDGFRWHARAFCQNDQVFKDFLLSRIIHVGATASATADPMDDAAWQTEVTLEIGPHPALSLSQARAIELDYDMQDGRARIQTRRALLFYTLRRLGLDTDSAARRPQDQQIVLLRMKELAP